MDPSPVFVWIQNPIAEHVIWYKLIVKNADGKKVYVEQVDAVLCSTGMCTSDLNASGAWLPNGAYEWFVKAKNSQGKSASIKLGLRIEFPGAATLNGPVHKATIVERSPVFSWSQVDVAADYRLRIEQDGKPVYTRWFSAAEVNCDGTSCWVDLSTLDTKLPRGKLRWRIHTRNLALSASVSKSSWNRLNIVRPTE